MHLYGMHSTDWNPRNRHARKYVSSDLETPHGERRPDNSARRSAELGEAHGGAHEQQAETRDEAELDKRERDGVGELVHDDLAGVGGQRGGGVPEGAEEDEADGRD